MGKNKKSLRERHYKRALPERNIYHMVRAPTLRNLKTMIKQNIIYNLPVTVKGIERAYTIFGPDVSTLKVIKKRQSPTVVVDNFIGIKRELIENNLELIMCMTIMFINQQALFTLIDKDMRFLVLLLISNIKKEECYRDLDVVTRHERKPGFFVQHIEYGGEFKSVMDEVIDEIGI